MSRRHAAQKRTVDPDAKFNHIVVTKFINSLMGKGKRSIAENIFYQALNSVSQKIKRQEVEVFDEIINSVRPAVEVRSKRFGGATYQVPVEVRDSRAIALAIRWIIAASMKRSEKTMHLKLAAEFTDIINLRGAALKKREDTHKMAEANKAFSHLKFA